MTRPSSSSINPEDHTHIRWQYVPIVAFIVLAFVALLIGGRA